MQHDAPRAFAASNQMRTAIEEAFMKPILFLACVVLLSPAVSFAKPPAATDGGVPVTMNVIVEGKDGKEPPRVTRQDLIVRQPNERREVNWWNPVGDKYSVAILI